MGILKQVLAEAFSPKGRVPSPPDARSPAPTDGGDAASSTRSGRRTWPAGMTAVVLNWNRGENDPFSVFNAAMRDHFQACGKNVEVVEIAQPGWASRLGALAASGIEFAYTWQGLGSDTRVTVGDRAEYLWEHLRIPLICVHGDHPSHYPPNHRLESRYCFHLYTNADFARYSNRHFRQRRGASVVDLPLLHREPRLDRVTGDWFVFAKNLTDPAETEEMWRRSLTPPAFAAYMMAAEVLRARVAIGPHIEIHDVLDALIDDEDLAGLHPAHDAAAYHQFHSQLDHYIRHHKSIVVVDSLRDIPLRVYGRGWDRIAQRAPASHAFAPGRAMADSQELFYSRYGIVDVSPSKHLHDRTRRAMANQRAFLSSARLEDRMAGIDRHESLFFGFAPGDLQARCAEVMRDPDAHLAAACRFADEYHERFHFREFVRHLEHLASLTGAP